MKKILSGVFVFALIFQMTAFAEVTIGERTGTLVITSPDGTVVTVGPNDPLPAILDGSSIQVVDGVAQISTTGTTTISVVAGGQTFQLAAGTTVNAMFEPTGAVLMEVTAGQATTTTADGRTATIDSGDQVRLSTTGSIEAIKGEVVLTDSTGKTETLGTGGKVEGYTPPAIPEVLDTSVKIQTEETARDISPVTT